MSAAQRTAAFQAAVQAKVAGVNGPSTMDGKSQDEIDKMKFPVCRGCGEAFDSKETAHEAHGKNGCGKESGERGYEIFCKGKDATHLWDSILSEGKSIGIRPCQFSTLDMLRIESYLLFYPGDNSETFPFEKDLCGDTIWELGLEFTVSPGKTGFIGAENHYPLEGKERFKIFGVQLSDGGMAQMDMGARCMSGDKDVGVITYGLSSELNGYSVAIARLDPGAAKAGTKLTIVQLDGTKLAATAEDMPFYDKDKTVRTAKG